MALLWILINVMCTVNIRDHEANFYKAEARCHEAEIEEEARKSEAELNDLASRPHGPRGLRGLNIPGFYRVDRRYARLVWYNYAVVLCPSVRPSQAGIASKRLQIKFYLLKTHHTWMQQVVKAVDEQGQQGSKEHVQWP